MKEDPKVSDSEVMVPRSGIENNLNAGPGELASWI